MTTWYSSWRTAPYDGPVLAYSVRPDLWPPGSYCWSSDLSLADWAVRPSGYPDAVDEANGVPGVGEALILAGQVVHGPGGDHLTWTETPDHVTSRTPGSP